MQVNILFKLLVMNMEDLSCYCQCADQVLVLRFVMERACEFGIDFYLQFIDFKQPYDTVHRKYLFGT